MRRGEKEVGILAGAMVGKLNEERCIKKGDWKKHTWSQLAELLRLEYEELYAEMWLASQGKADGLYGILEEAPDVGNVAAFCLDKALSEIVEKGD